MSVFFDETNSCLGTQLLIEDKIKVLNRFIHRYTGDHLPRWAKSDWQPGVPYPLHFLTDDEWLAHTRFRIRNDGRLDGRCRFCESHPTYPRNPELRTLFNNAETAMTNTDTLSDIPCPDCGGTVWVIDYDHSVTYDSEKNMVTDSNLTSVDVRCVDCQGSPTQSVWEQITTASEAASGV